MSNFVAVNDFRRARRRAAMEQILARIQGESIDLLSYEEVRNQLRAVHARERGLQDIPIDAIVGTAGRYADFTRSFLPRKDSDQARWSKVRAAQVEMEGLPPIEVYQIGEAYFVKDGHHRVSVARQLEATHIEAYVTEVTTRVPLQPKDRPGDLILKSELAAFLERTELDRLFPEVDFSVTQQAGTDRLFEHIAVHRHFLGENEQREISFQEAVKSWVLTIYEPVREIIRYRGMLRDFPGRTEADLYLWIGEHKAELAETLTWEVDTERAAVDLSRKESSLPGRVLSRVRKRVLDAITPDRFEVGPAPGQWRRSASTQIAEVGLFPNILVPIRGDEASWEVLDHALLIAQRERARLWGLHVVADPEDRDSTEVRTMQQAFARRMESSRVEGKLSIGEGSVVKVMTEMSSWVDLLVVSLLHPPGTKPLERLSSGFRSLIHRAGRPVMAIPEGAPPPSKVLLAYDGSPRSIEALYVSAYLAGVWKMSLLVVAVEERGEDAQNNLLLAEEYLGSQGIFAEYMLETSQVAEALLDVAGRHQCDLVVMGGYNRAPLVEVVLGSNVDTILRFSSNSVLICT